MAVIIYFGVAIVLSTLITIFWEDDFDHDFVGITLLISIFWPFFALFLTILVVFGWPIFAVIFFRKWRRSLKA